MSGIPSEEEFLNEGLTAEEQSAVALAPEPAPIADSDPAAPVEPPKVDEPAAEPKMVDVRAVQEARASERALREEVAREREARARLEERWNMLLSAQKAAAEEGRPQPPSEEEDIVGFLKHQADEARREAAMVRNMFEQRMAVEQQMSQVNQIVANADAIYEVARTKHADVNDAFQFAVEATRRDIAEKGYTGQQADQVFQQVLFEYAKNCPPDPDKAADYIRRSARWWGWGGPQPAAVAPVAQQQVQALAERTERHMSLSGISGAEAPRQLDAKAVASMSDEEFFKLASRLSEKEMDRLMGAA